VLAAWRGSGRTAAVLTAASGNNDDDGAWGVSGVRPRGGSDGAAACVSELVELEASQGSGTSSSLVGTSSRHRRKEVAGAASSSQLRRGCAHRGWVEFELFLLVQL
jgi:hypothetical protein